MDNFNKLTTNFINGVLSNPKIREQLPDINFINSSAELASNYVLGSIRLGLTPEEASTYSLALQALSNASPEILDLAINKVSDEIRIENLREPAKFADILDSLPNSAAKKLAADIRAEYKLRTPTDQSTLEALSKSIASTMPAASGALTTVAPNGRAQD